jgi:hypothetical protein
MADGIDRNQPQAMTVLMPAELYRQFLRPPPDTRTFPNITRQAVLAKAREDGFGPKTQPKVPG